MIVQGERGRLTLLSNCKFKRLPGGGIGITCHRSLEDAGAVLVGPLVLIGGCRGGGFPCCIFVRLDERVVSSLNLLWMFRYSMLMLTGFQDPLGIGCRLVLQGTEQ